MNVKSAIESILFIQGEPITAARLAKAVGAPKAGVEKSLRELQSGFHDRGIQLIVNGEEWQLVTSPASKAVVEKFVRSDVSGELSKAALEVLAIITYKGPISRAAIEYIRGVDSSFTLRNLLVRGLVSREENPKDRRSYLYRISMDFLKHLGLASPAELPHYGELHRTNIEAPSAATP